MSICHVVGDSAFGGGSQIVVELVRAAVADGARVTVVATDPVFGRHLHAAGAEVVEIRGIAREIDPLRDLRSLWRLRAYFRRTKHDIVHTHTSKAGFVGRIAARLAGVPIVVHTAHGFSFHEASPAHVRRSQAALERFAARFCDRIVTVSEFHRRWAMALGLAAPEKIVAIPNGIPDPRRRLGRARSAVRQELGIGDDQVMVVSASRLAPGKGLEHLVRAADRLRQEGRRELRMVIAGIGSLMEPLREEIGRSDLDGAVMMLGFRDDVADLLAAADVAVLPSEREGLSIALLEAMAAGCALVCSDIGSNVEAAGEAAVLHAYGDVEGIAEGIRRLADDPQRRRALAAAARIRYLERYTLDRMLAAYGSLYETLQRDREHA